MKSEVLEGTYRDALDRVTPERLIRRWFESNGFAPAAVISIGKCAASMLEGVPPQHRSRVFSALPEAYPTPPFGEVHFGGHPRPNDASLTAGDALFDFVRSVRGRVLLLLSGGSSACIDVVNESLIDRSTYFVVMQQLHSAGMPIERMNAVRANLSYMKGGGLGAMLPPGSVALIVSDVDPETPSVVGSGPTYDAPSAAVAVAALETVATSEAREVANRLSTLHSDRRTSSVRNVVVADNRTLLGAAAARLTTGGHRVLIHPRQIEGDVSSAAKELLAMIPDENIVVIAGGEPTVAVRGDGLGGRCSELVLHIVATNQAMRKNGLILTGSSDGVDGSSLAAGFTIQVRSESSVDIAAIGAALERSDSYPLAAQLAEPIMMPVTGNNLRDIYLLSRT